MCALVLSAGFMFKGQCAQNLGPGRSAFNERAYARLCYNDLQPLYGIRLISEDVFPYVHGDLDATNGLVGGAIEYPVLTGVFMWVAGKLVSSDTSYLVVSAVLLAPFGLVTAYLLEKLTGRRALLWAAAPAVVLYAFHNWDLLVVAACVAGFYQWRRGRPLWAGVLFGVGAGVKMYPLFFLAPLLLERLQARDKRGALQGFGGGLGAVLLVNLPFALVNFDGWFATYEFHRLRGPNYDNIWTWPPSWFPALTPDRINLITALLTAGFFIAALAYGWRRGRREGAYPFVAVSAALLATFLLWNKVHSPQYALWILPFFVLLRVHIGWWIAYSVVDIVVYVGVFRFFNDQASNFFRRMMVGGVWLRAGLLVALVVVFLRARPWAEDDRGKVVGTPVPRKDAPVPVAAGATVAPSVGRPVEVG